MPTHVPVLIIGAGISGLVCAHALRKSGVDAQIVEPSPRPGGVIHSERRNGYLLEFGPQSFSATPQILDLCRDLGIESELLAAPPRAPRFLLINGKLQQAPWSPPAFLLSSLFSLRTKWSFLRDVLGKTTAPDTDESVADFVRRKFTRELLEKLVSPFVSGIYAGDPEKLSLRAAFPQLHEAERSTGSVIRGLKRAATSAKSKGGPKQRPTLQSFTGGNQTLTNALAANLGTALRCGAEVTMIQRGGAGHPQLGRRFVVDLKSGDVNETMVADRLVLATPPDATANLLKTVLQDIDPQLLKIEFAPLAVVSLGYKKADIAHSLEGYGFLVPRSEGRRILGTVWNSSLFPDRAPEGHALLTSFLGGATDSGAVFLPTEEIISIVHRELASLLSIRGTPVFSHVQLYERALPQYNLGHVERISSIERQCSYLANLRLEGNYLHGPSIGACVEQALSVANEMRIRKT
jgi:protoporphyrinogen/coproporphyrinogen III oxidase